MKNLLELVMIVKNSGSILRRVLIDIKPYIDYWTILDTGSTDGTQQLIRESLSGVEGKLYEESFIDFMTTRNRSLELASQKCKYMIILDDSYCIRGGDKLRDYLDGGDKNCYHIGIVNSLKNTRYYSNRIILSNSKKRYEKYKIHEAIPDNEYNMVPSECFIMDEIPSYHIQRSEFRHNRDIEILRGQLDEYPNDSRILYYLGKTYDIIGEKKNAYRYFQKILTLTQVQENEMYEAMMYVNEYHEHIEGWKWNKLEKELFQIVKKYPHRLEPVFRLFMREYNSANYSRCYKYIDICNKVKEPSNYPYEYNYNIYRMYVPYFYIDLSIRMGMFSQASTALQKILTVYPDNQRFLNIKYSLLKKIYQPVYLSNKKTIVIHSGGCNMSKPWNPQNLHNECSGSEMMVVGVARELSIIGYRVFVFGYFDNHYNWDGVEYYDYRDFNEFIQKYYIDTLIISRYSENLVYYDNIEKVYLWVHDVYPQDTEYIFQTHPSKFKGLLCLSKWQQNLNRKEYNLPVYLTHNAIDIELYKKDVIKQPYRFIWTSNVLRGLNYGVDMFREIQQKYKNSVFYIFGDSSNISPELLYEINNCGDIHLRDRIKNDELVVELLKSDVWLYPNNFEETYCISAVEAQASGCLVCCNVHAGLEDTVGDRGAVIHGKYNKDKLLRELYRILDNTKIKNKIIDRGVNFASTQIYNNLIRDWINSIL